MAGGGGEEGIVALLQETTDGCAPQHFSLITSQNHRRGGVSFRQRLEDQVELREDST